MNGIEILKNCQPEIQDSTKLSCFAECPRKYFFSYCLGWRRDWLNHDLHFGQSWHLGREHQLRHGYADVEGAFSAFLKHYRTQVNGEQEMAFDPKTSAHALLGLETFALERSADEITYSIVELNNVKALEFAGHVPFDATRTIYFKMDSIVQTEEGFYYSIDHKTSSAKWLKTEAWEKSFNLSIQNGTYTHVLYSLFPMEKVRGVIFDGIGFETLKRGSAQRPAGPQVTLNRVDASRTPEQMESWYVTVSILWNELEASFKALESCTELDSTLETFRLNPHACGFFNGCEFRDFCELWANPLARCDVPPVGFKVSLWDPRTDSGATTVLDPTTKSLKGVSHGS